MRITTDPQTESWLKCAALPASAKNPALTGIFDLDRTLFVNAEQISAKDPLPSKFTVPYTFFSNGYKELLHVDPDAMAQITLFAQSGHTVMVSTNATYTFSSMEALFKHYGIILKKEHFFNQDTVKQYGYNVHSTCNSKALFLQKKLPELMLERSNTLLFDDNSNNDPKRAALFLEIDERGGFPTLVPQWIQAAQPESIQNPQKNDISIYRQLCSDNNLDAKKRKTLRALQIKPLEDALKSLCEQNLQAAKCTWDKFINHEYAERLIEYIIKNHANLLPANTWKHIIQDSDPLTYIIQIVLKNAIEIAIEISQKKSPKEYDRLQKLFSTDDLSSSLALTAENVQRAIEGKKSFFCFCFADPDPPGLIGAQPYLEIARQLESFQKKVSAPALSLLHIAR